ncbi:hypothetical protein MCEKH45_01007 [Methylophilaceae bacterium]
MYSDSLLQALSKEIGISPNILNTYLPYGIQCRHQATGKYTLTLVPTPSWLSISMLPP